MSPAGLCVGLPLEQFRYLEITGHITRVVWIMVEHDLHTDTPQTRAEDRQKAGLWPYSSNNAGVARPAYQRRCNSLPNGSGVEDQAGEQRRLPWVVALPLILIVSAGVWVGLVALLSLLI